MRMYHSASLDVWRTSEGGNVKKKSENGVLMLTFILGGLDLAPCSNYISFRVLYIAVG